MAQRKRVALIFSYNESWIAGSYYIQNLIRALNYLPDLQKPVLVVLCKQVDIDRVRQIQYPYLVHFDTNISHTFAEKFINKVSRWVNGKNVFEKRPVGDLADAFFPMSIEDFFGRIPIEKTLFWIPDFQEYHLPQFFAENQIINRRSQQNAIVQRQSPIVFSSKDAEADFKLFFPSATNPTYVLPFAVTHEPYQEIDIDELKTKYRITKPYYFSPNQFWKHKNHMVLLKAVRLLAYQRADFQVVFTGKEFDHRNPTYFEELQGYVQEQKLEDFVRFLGFIDRKDQLQLMKHSLAVIQPSLFEGWSTVVEDAKAMSQFVILSDIRVHKEQMQDNVVFFNPLDEYDLADKICNSKVIKTQINYQESVMRFGQGFLELIDMTTNKTTL